MSVSLLRPTLAVLAGLALAGCELLPPRPISVAETEVVSVTGFDRARADALVADADAAAARGDTAGALADYRQAGLAWPESEAAWLGLRTTSDALGDEGEQLVLRRVFRQNVLLRVDSEDAARPDLGGDIGLRCGIVADQDDRQPRRQPLLRQRRHLGAAAVQRFRGDGFSVDEIHGRSGVGRILG